MNTSRIHDLDSVTPHDLGIGGEPTIRISQACGLWYVEDLTGNADPEDVPEDGFEEMHEAEDAALPLLVELGGDVEWRL